MPEPTVSDAAVEAYIAAESAYLDATSGEPDDPECTRAGLVAALPHLAGVLLRDHVEQDRRLSNVVAEAIARKIEEENIGECSGVYDRCAAIAREVGRRAGRPNGSAGEESR